MRILIHRWLTGQEWLSWLFWNLKLLDGLLDWKVTRPVAEALAADRPDRVTPALRQVDERLAAVWRPHSLLVVR
ncbi:hypothetical protein E7T06_20315 [Deinococcus sp. Arct2-2]|uniref:hypothetical protein n=1 Tax=Deinococcus sp. Arct2-2 TaxID=2568653 RepID=UPI0010A4C27D|nr:hypothetical protein [Deinococcus sp. Arct2-2]THF66808.1 hypothetical protein E7T06_20315 [Deinococcus sp. Arct2-2]